MNDTISTVTEQKKWLYIFLGAWFLLNVLQSVFTELFHDEALYWAFAERVSWGYFDHPPVTAWLIALTSWLPGELGVRLPFILMTCGTVYFLWRLIQPKDALLFHGILAGLPLMHVGGFFAAPDVPLIFLMTLFLFWYKSYYYQDSYLIAIALGVTLGLMGLAKYHAILFALALALSNVTLFKRKSFYLLVAMAFVVVLPHLIWQWQHDWVSFRFHLFSRRGAAPWSWLFVGDYIAGQLAIYGLLLSLILMTASIRYQPNDHYDCAYKYTFFTVFLFFTLSVFRGRVEANWTAMAMPPVVYLSYFFLESRKNWRKWTLVFAGISLFVVLALRLILAVEIIDPSVMNRNETHGFKSWAEGVAKEADGRPVVFLNSYQKPSKYRFYTGNEVFGLSTARYSGSQYDIWTEDEIALHGKEVLLISNELTSNETLSTTSGFKAERLLNIENWVSYNYLNIDFELPEVASNSRIEEGIMVEISNPTSFEPVSSGRPVQLHALFYQYGQLKHRSILMSDVDVEGIGPDQTLDLEVSFNYPSETGEYDVKMSLVHDRLDGLNSWSKKVVVVE